MELEETLKIGQLSITRPTKTLGQSAHDRRFNS